MGTRKIRFARSFGVTFDAALAFLTGHHADAATTRLHHAVLHDLPALLRRHPLIGRDFMRRNPASAEAGDARTRVVALLGDRFELREYMLADHLLLYAVSTDAIYLLAIRHHRQNSCFREAGRCR